MPIADHYKGGTTEKLIVTIVTVDPSTNRIEGVGKDAAVLQIRPGGTGPIFRWPKQGEPWIITRINTDWFLESPAMPLTVLDAQPGDLIGPDGFIPQTSGEVAPTSATFSIGDGVSRIFALAHDLNSRDVYVLVYASAAPYSEVTAEVEHTDLNTITIKTDVNAPAPTTNQYNVLVSSALGGVSFGGDGGGAPEVHVGAEPPSPRGDKLIWVDTDEVATGGYLDADARLTVLEADSGWIDLSLTSPWIQYDATPNFRAQYRRLHGVVYIRGLVRNTVAFSYAGAGSNLTIATLPVGFRPLGTLMGEGYASDANASELILRLDLQSTDGALKIILAGDWVISGTGNSGTVGWLKLNFVPYPADN